MKTKIDINTWNRRDHFNFFNSFDEPFFGITTQMDCTETYLHAKANKQSFFLLYLHKTLAAANRVENFKYRIIDGEVWKYDVINASVTINRTDETFGFCYLNFHEDFEVFSSAAALKMEEIRNERGLRPSASGDNVIQCSALPWLNFTSMSHARNFSFPDSCPKLAYGKITDLSGRKIMPVSVHVHHGLVDGLQVSQFVNTYQDLLNIK